MPDIVGPDQVPNCLQRLSAEGESCGDAALAEKDLIYNIS